MKENQYAILKFSIFTEPGTLQHSDFSWTLYALYQMPYKKGVPKDFKAFVRLFSISTLPENNLYFEKMKYVDLENKTTLFPCIIISAPNLGVWKFLKFWCSLVCSNQVEKDT